jgi:hypothetical protein
MEFLLVAARGMHDGWESPPPFRGTPEKAAVPPAPRLGAELHKNPRCDGGAEAGRLADGP